MCWKGGRNMKRLVFALFIFATGCTTSSEIPFYGNWAFKSDQSDNRDTEMVMILKQGGKLTVFSKQTNLILQGNWSIRHNPGKIQVVIDIYDKGKVIGEALNIQTIGKDEIHFVIAADRINGAEQEALPNTVTLTRYPHSLAPFTQDNRIGFRSITSGEIIVEPKYTQSITLGKGLISVYTNGKWKVLDNGGKETLEIFTYDNGPDYFKEGLARFVKDGKMGFFDETGKIVIPAQFDFVYPFEGGKAQFVSGGKMVSDGEHSTIQGGKSGTVDKQGKFLE